MDSVLKDKNEIITESLAQNLSISKSDNIENSYQNAKENHNPKSLLEIASDSSKLMNITITPTKKEINSLNEMEFNEYSTENFHDESKLNKTSTTNHNPKSLIDIANDTTAKLKFKNTSTPLNSRNVSRMISQESNVNDESYTVPPKSDHIDGLSFLLEGMGKLQVNANNGELSDDEEEFLSFNNNQIASLQSSAIVEKKKEVQKEINKSSELNITAENIIPKLEHVEIPIIDDNVHENSEKNCQSNEIGAEQTFDVIESLANNNFNNSRMQNEEEELLDKTEVIKRDDIELDLSKLSTDEKGEGIEKEDSQIDVTMQSINETFEKEVTSLQEQDTKNISDETFQKNPLEKDSSKIEFAQPEKVTLAKIPPVATAPEEVFMSGASYNFGDSDFDYLQKFGKTPADDLGRDSVLLKFDPLFEKPVPLKQLGRLSEAKEEDSFSDLVLKDFNTNPQSFDQENHSTNDSSFSNIDEYHKSSSSNNAKSMNIDIMKDISSQNDKIDSNLECADIKLSSINNEDQNTKLEELENKLKMEAEQREEGLLKRISEKDKQISKMNNVVEAYEKAISELIAEKEQLIQSYEKKCNDLKSDSEMNAQHLASLESTFSDLHAKYERTKQIASELKDHEESILQDRKSLQDNLKMQEARYEKMKTHAMAQLEIANNKLAEMLRNHQAEVTKLKAQLKKEEISRASVHEQLIQKSKENAELVKICDELIGNHGNSQTA